MLFQREWADEIDGSEPSDHQPKSFCPLSEVYDGNYPPRSYQIDLINAVEKELGYVNSTLIVAATGSGKTVLCSHLIRRWIANHWNNQLGILFLAHRKELIEQAHQKIQQILGNQFLVQQEIGDIRATPMPMDRRRYHVVVASKDTLCSQLRLDRFGKGYFDLAIVDECFPAGTLIDGRRIESLKIGDMIRSFNHRLGTIEIKPISRIFKSNPGRLVSVYLSDGRKIICTAGHPFYSISKGCYVPAYMLSCDDMVLDITDKGEIHGKKEDSGIPVQYMREDDVVARWDSQILLERVQIGNVSSCSQERSCINVLCMVQESCMGCWLSSEKRESVLFGGMQKEIFLRFVFQDNGENKSEICFREDEKKQSYESGRCQGKGFYNFESHGMEAANFGREWSRSNNPRAAIVLCSWMADSVGCKNKDGQIHERLSDQLQIRCWESVFEDRYRNRWPQSLFIEEEGTGSEETKVFRGSRVVCVEVHEQTSCGTFGGLCPDGFVYNIEVEDNHNYFAEGILVHNCHHFISANASYKNIGRYYGFPSNECKLIGVTATPDRGSGESLSCEFETCAGIYDIFDAIQDGWLVPIIQEFVTIHDMQLHPDMIRRMKDGRRDYSPKRLDTLMRQSKVIFGLVNPLIDISEEGGDKRPTLIFCTSVNHAKECADILNNHRTGCAAFLHGKKSGVGGISDKKRKRILDQFRDGKIQYISNCGILTEGFDNDRIKVIGMGRPTKLRSLYSQIVGRSLRPLGSIVPLLHRAHDSQARRAIIRSSSKPFATIVDPVGASSNKLTISSADVLGGWLDDEIVERVIRRNKNRTSIDVAEEILQAIRDKEEDERMEKSRLKIDVKYTKRRVDPFDLFDMPSPRESVVKRSKPLSDAQRNSLEKFGFKPVDLDKLTSIEAKDLIEECFIRAKNGEATFRQIKLLKKYGVDASRMTFREASDTIQQIANNGWEHL